MNERPEWFAVYTRPSAESKVSASIRALALEPLFLFVVRWVQSSVRGKSRCVRRALFPRYVFVRSARERLSELALNNHDVSGIVSADGYPLAIPDFEIERLKRTALPSGEVLMGKAREKRFKKGDKLEIIDEYNPFRGFSLQYLSGYDIIQAELVEKGLKISIPLNQVQHIDSQTDGSQRD